MSRTSQARCRLCQQAVHPIADFGLQPLANSLEASDTLPGDDARYPLALGHCPTCSLLQLTENVPPSQLFDDYLYETRFSDPLTRSFRELADKLTASLALGPDDLVYDIGSNDGTLLSFYGASGVRVHGVDPSSAADTAWNRGIATTKAFLNPQTASSLVKDVGKGSVVHIHNCLAHCPNVVEVIESLATLLRTDGVLVVETPDVLDLLENLRVDTVYHEHVFYFSFTALRRALSRAGLRIWRVERTTNHGCSLRVFADTGSRTPELSVREALARDEIGSASDTGRHLEFAGHLQRAAENLRAFLTAERSRGHIAAYGAAAKATVLFNVFGIDSPLVDYAVDDSPLKVGRRIPGTSIVIHDVGELARRNPATVLVTAWNYAEAIARKHESLSARGTRFATPLPTPRFVEPNPVELR
jgi:SAM-dependent methyltransferase